MRVAWRDLRPGEAARAAFDERVPLQVDGTAADVAVHGEVEVSRTAQSVVLRGEVAAEDVPLLCSRCLTPLRQPLHAALDEEFSLNPAPPARGELAPGDFVAWVGPNQELDVSDVVRQHLQMAVPMVPLCRQNCRGLCPICGVNWNEQRCEHEASLPGG